MDKETIKAFIAWLESASIEEIEKRRDLFIETSKKVSTSSGRSDIKFGLKLIDEELVARLELAKIGKA